MASQQRADDPRRGGKTSNDVKKMWDTESADSTIGGSSDEAGDILGDALKNIFDDPHGEFGTAGSIEIDSSHGHIKIGNDHTTVHRMEDSEEIESNTETYWDASSQFEESNELDFRGRKLLGSI